MDVTGAQTLCIQDLNHCMQKTRKHFPRVETPRTGRKKKRTKICLRKWQWEMYSPSGSKRFQLKRNWAYSRVGLAVCRLVYTEALRLFCALRSLLVVESCDFGLVRVFESVRAFFLYSLLSFSAFLFLFLSDNVTDFST